jgi:hypothetical protein
VTEEEMGEPISKEEANNTILEDTATKLAEAETEAEVEVEAEAVEAEADVANAPADAANQPDDAAIVTGDVAIVTGDAAGEPEEPPEEYSGASPGTEGVGGEEGELGAAPETDLLEAPAGRTGLTPLGERVKAHVMAVGGYVPDLTTEETYNELLGTEDLNYDLREDCREITKLMQQVGSSKFAVGDYLIKRHWPPIQISRFGHIYWHHKPKPRYRELVKFPELPCSKSELADCVALALQKRSLDEIHGENSGYCDHMTVSQLILLTRVKDLADKGAVIRELKKHPKNFVQMREWMRARGYLKAAKVADPTKKLIESFARLVQNVEENLPALEEVDPQAIGFGLLGSWRQRLGAVVSLLTELEEEERAVKAA